MQHLLPTIGWLTLKRECKTMEMLTITFESQLRADAPSSPVSRVGRNKKNRTPQSLDAIENNFGPAAACRALCHGLATPRHDDVCSSNIMLLLSHFAKHKAEQQTGEGDGQRATPHTAARKPRGRDSESRHPFDTRELYFCSRRELTTLVVI